MEKSMKALANGEGQGDAIGKYVGGYHPKFVQRAMRLERLDPSSPDHPDNLRAVGAYWRAMRKQKGLSRNEVAKRLNMPEHELAYFEQGLVSPLDLGSGFAKRLSEAIGNAAAYELYMAGSEFPVGGPQHQH